MLKFKHRVVIIRDSTLPIYIHRTSKIFVVCLALFNDLDILIAIPPLRDNTFQVKH